MRRIARRAPIIRSLKESKSNKASSKTTIQTINTLLATMIVAEDLCGWRSREVKISCCEPPVSAIFSISFRLSLLISTSTTENNTAKIDKTTKPTSLIMSISSKRGITPPKRNLSTRVRENQQPNLCYLYHE